MLTQTTLSTTTIAPEAVQSLKNTIKGLVLLPNSEGYHQARAVWNGMIDRRPGLIVKCANVSDVVQAVNFGRKHQLLVAVRGGGHSGAGLAVCDDGMVIDLSLMKETKVDATNKIAHAQPGVLWGELDKATQEFGLAVTGGLVSTTGIAGLTLGGGIGWLMGKYGLTCDNLLSAEVVTADGMLITASPNQNSDLFWAIRGGGGNFGIVTSFEYQLNQVGTVLGGMVLHPIEKTKDVLRFFREFTADAPDEVTTYAVALTTPDGIPMIAIILCYCGADLEEGERIIAPVRKFGPPVVDMLGPMPYAVQQTLFDAATPHGQYSYWKSNQLNDLSDEAIETFHEYVNRISSPRTAVLMEHHHGAMSRIAPAATAFRHRKAPYDLVILTLWNGPEESETHIRWSRDFFKAMKPFFSSGVYVNAIYNDEGAERVRAAYGDNFERLVQVKQKYDPTNFFRFNNNIVP